jgi:hypothetical protein
MKRLSESVDQWGVPLTSKPEQPLEEAASAQAIKVWRIVSNILPAQADPHYRGSGIHGEGTYFRPEKYEPIISAIKTWGSKFDDEANWDLFTEYDLTLKNVAHLNDENTERLWSDDYIGLKDNPLKIGKFYCYDVEKLAYKKGFDAVLITGEDVDGGNTLFVPFKSKPKAITKRHHLITKDKSLAAKIGKAIGEKATSGKVSFGPEDEKQVSDILMSVNDLPEEAAVTEGARGDWEKEGYKIALIPHGDWQGDYEIPDFNPKEHDFVLVVRDKGGKEAGYAHVTHHSPITVGIAEVAIKKPHKRKGIGTEIYRQAEKISGKKLIPSEELSDEAEALWSQPNRPFGESVDPWGFPNRS